jgi:lactoylglutathione lyase
VFTSAFPILYSRDLPRSIHFYRDLLGMSETFRFPAAGDPAFVTLTLGSASIGIGTYDQVDGLEARNLRPPVEGRGFEMCIYSDDVDAAIDHLRAAGVRVLVDPVDKHWGERLAYVEDPDGNAVMITAPLG